MKVVIVESPNKCKTIEKYLGDDYKVISTKGHVRDLAISGKNGLGVDCDNDFKPTYTIIKDKKKIVEEIKKISKKADEIILATDPDREGEAIAWHLSEILKLKKDNKRLEFHEITRDSILNAINNPRSIDLKLVASQEVRRIIDRIIGFRLSNVLQKMKNLKSAGRVQSATLRLIVEHEKKISDFKPIKYWIINSIFRKDNKEIKTNLYEYKGKNYSDVKIESEELANEIVNETKKNKILKVLDIKKKIKTINSKIPFITSTIQQDAITKLNMSASKVSYILQELYEGIKIKDEIVGLITYIRTDSPNLSSSYIEDTKKFIAKKYGNEYVKKEEKKIKKKEFVQNAHEAIRPINNNYDPESIKEFLTNDQYKLYKLIYNRTLGYLMVGKKEEITTVIIGNEKVSYKIYGSKLIYYGFEILNKDNLKKDKELGFKVNVNDDFNIVDVQLKYDFTKPPDHLTEASVIKLMEEKGIGRPSTYSKIVTLLLERLYVIKDKNSIIPTNNGLKVIDFLKDKFPDIVNIDFTAKLESDLDKVNEDKKSRVDIINKIYIPFIKELNVVLQEKIGLCPICNSQLIRVRGKNSNFFTGCSNFPKCKYVKKEPKEKLTLLDKKCPKCNNFLVKRISKKGKVFIGCSGFPKCHYIENANKSNNSDKIKEKYKND